MGPIRTGLVLTLAAGLGACAATAGGGAAPGTSFTPPFPSHWQFQTVQGQKVRGERPLTLDFDETGGVSGFSGCNRFSGRAMVQNGELRFSPMVSTRMACMEADLNAQERTVLDALTNAERFVSGPDGAADMYSRRAAGPSRLVPAPATR